MKYRLAKNLRFVLAGLLFVTVSFSQTTIKVQVNVKNLRNQACQKVETLSHQGTLAELDPLVQLLVKIGAPNLALIVLEPTLTLDYDAS